MVPSAQTMVLLLAKADERERVAVERATRDRGVRLEIVNTCPGDFGAGFASMKRARVDALLVGRGPALRTRKPLIQLAVCYRIPAKWEARITGEERGLLFYRPSFADLFRLVASALDRIIKGANPARLPVEQPTTFEPLINAKTANTLGLTISPSSLLRADQVIE